VEGGIAPNQIIGSGTNFTRPLCPYPKVRQFMRYVSLSKLICRQQFAKYIHGDVNNASSFVCQ
jgi:feruloyl esterase